MIVAITGHRPEDLPDLGWVYDALSHAYNDLGATHVIQGMAAGVDLIAARAANHAKIPFTCAKPWKTHKGRNSGSQGFVKSWETWYDNAIKYSDKVVDVTEYTSYPGPWIYQTRNKWMVDNADMLIAVWTGKENGGTYNCVKYAIEQKKPIYRLNPSDKTASLYA